MLKCDKDHVSSDRPSVLSSAADDDYSDTRGGMIKRLVNCHEKTVNAESLHSPLNELRIFFALRSG
jgi:hypothetical protein